VILRSTVASSLAICSDKSVLGSIVDPFMLPAVIALAWAARNRKHPPAEGDGGRRLGQGGVSNLGILIEGKAGQTAEVRRA
jgi:hypothetical protein